MGKSFLISLAVGGCLLLGGCATANGPRFDPHVAPDPHQGLILFFRPNVFYGGGVAPDVYLDDDKVRSIDNGGYIEINAAPGEHVITVPHNFWDWDEDCSPAVVNVAAGHVYYVELEMVVRKYRSFLLYTEESRCMLKQLAAKDALPLIKLTRLSK